jgi:adenine-specific DNA-methyltransferase
MKTDDQTKLDTTSHDIFEQNREKIQELFPTCIVEGKIDFELLKKLLGDEDALSKEEKERYGLYWPGKNELIRLIQQPSTATLEPDREQSVDYDKSQNVYIEGENLEVLKLLQRSYSGMIKMIYIDPPYNTGKDFVYPDDFKEPLQNYLSLTGQLDDEGNKVSTNSETEGRYHTNWLNMMYPRLFLARNLLKDDGVIFISIDDNEVANLRKICDEIFGEKNFVGQSIRISNSAKNNSNYISVVHDYCLIYSRNIEKLPKGWLVPKKNATEFERIADRLLKNKGNLLDVEKELKELVKNPKFYDFDHYYYCDENGVYRTDNSGGVDNGNKITEIIHPVTGKPCAKPVKGWRYTEQKIKEMLAKGQFHFGIDEMTIPLPKRYLKDYLNSIPSSVSFYDTQTDSHFFKRESLPFDFPKPLQYLIYILQMANVKESDIILDFFSGSATTAHATISLNKTDLNQRKYIMVQIPEKTTPESEAYKVGHKSIADIGRERIRRASKNIVQEMGPEKAKELDLGFKAYKLVPSNFKTWNGNKKEFTAEQLQLQVTHISDSASDESVLYEIILKAGIPLDVSIKQMEIHGKKIYQIASHGLVLCLEKGITMNVINGISELNPVRVICLDDCFIGNDQLKTNAVQHFRGKDIEFKSV